MWAKSRFADPTSPSGKGYGSMLIIILILIIALGVAATGIHQAFRAHTRRYGLLPVVWRWFSGRQRHGLEGDDRRRDDKFDPHSKHYEPVGTVS
jgi:hypothetical protein